MNLNVWQQRVSVRIRARNVVVTNDLNGPPDTELITSDRHYLGGAIIMNLSLQL
jgi:hypothetical protein